jgi:hypothetical protein
MSPRVVLQFPKRPKADCQGERLPYSISLTEQIQRIKCLDAGMSKADIQHEQDAQQAERIIEYWIRKLADNPRRGPSKTATFLCTHAGSLNGDEAS